MIRYMRLLRGLFALALAGSVSACVTYPVYDTPPPSTVYYVEQPWGCDPYYGPCAPGYGYSSGYWYGGYYGYPAYGYPYYYGYPYHDHPRHDRGDGDDDTADWIRNWPPRDRPDDRPSDRPGTRPGTRPGSNKPGVVYAPKPPRLVPDDRKIPRDPGPSAQRESPGRVVPVRRPESVRDNPSTERSLPRVERSNAKPAPVEAPRAAPVPREESSSKPEKPERRQSGRSRDSRRPD